MSPELNGYYETKAVLLEGYNELFEQIGSEDTTDEECAVIEIRIMAELVSFSAAHAAFIKSRNLSSEFQKFYFGLMDEIAKKAASEEEK